MYYLVFRISARDFIIDLVNYWFPTIALGISILSFFNSRKASKIQERLNIVEEKLMNYELEEVEKKREDASKALIEARIYKVSKSNYRIKIWNSGGATAYNVNFSVPDEHKGIILKQKVPYEFLEPNKSFEEYVLVHSGTPPKLMVKTTWESKNGSANFKEQLIDVY